MDLEKEFICEEVPKLPEEDRIRILTIIKNHDESKIKRFPDGSRVNLDNLPEPVLRDLHSRIKYILDLDTQ